MGYGNDYALDRGYERSESMSAARATFIRRTYAHLAGAILVFLGLMGALLQIPDIDRIVLTPLITYPGSWLLVLLAFGLFGSLARYWASSQTSIGMQYLGLGFYTVLEALIFLPLMCVARVKFSHEPNLVPTAGILTLAVVAGLTAVVFVSRKDFSFLGSILAVGFFIALGAIIASFVFGFTLGLFFCVAMIVLMSVAILYETSNVLHHYHTDSHVAASLALFAAIATMFWYVIQLLMSLSERS